MTYKIVVADAVFQNENRLFHHHLLFINKRRRVSVLLLFVHLYEEKDYCAIIGNEN
jgi:hypothetical protein